MTLSTELTWRDWSFEATVVFGLLILTAVYLLLAVRAGHAKAAWYAAGVAALFVALQSPIDVGGDRYLFSLHMLQHIILAMVAPPLLLLGMTGLVPWRPRGLAALMVHPWVAALVFNAVLLVWHLPQLYDATLRQQPLHILEHVSFFLTGLAFWWPVVEPQATSPAPLSPVGKIAYLAFNAIPPTILGLVFAIAPAASYPFYVEAPRLWGLSPVEDQQLAGLVMFGLGGFIYVAAIAALFVQFAGERGPDAANLHP